MEHNQTIGLGCDRGIFALAEPNDKKMYYVYRLLDKSQVINLDDSDEEMETKPKIVNAKVDANVVASDSEINREPEAEPSSGACNYRFDFNILFLYQYSNFYLFLC